ncbi:MAG: hypothetical protein ACF8Q5_09610 [Phycisphaerales bacterium JB040]
MTTPRFFSSLHDQSPTGRLGRLCVFLLVGAVTILGCRTAQAQPQPDPIPTRWEFRFEPGPLRLALINVEGVGLQRYFYFTYRITNYWDNDLLFAPDVQLRTSEATVIRSGRDVPREVTRSIIERLDNPLIEDQISIVGQVLQGPEHARDGVVIWPAEDLDVDEVTIFFGGLSGETRVYETGEGDDARRFTLRKTMMLRYDTPGELGDRDNHVIPLAEERWIMR